MHRSFRWIGYGAGGVLGLAEASAAALDRFGLLTDAEVRALYGYLRSFGQTPPTERK